MLTTIAGSAPLDRAVHIIQLALTPVFLLSGIAALLNVFAARLARVADQVERVSEKLKLADQQEARILSRRLGLLRRRSWILDVAVILGAVGGASTSGTTLALFISSFGDNNLALVLIGLFGIALICTIGALAAFLTEILLESRGLRAVADQSDAVPLF